MIINDLFNNKKFVAEDIGDLGSKRDQGKSVRKWRKSRGLDETGQGPVTHRIGLTVTDPNHPMVSKRKETIQKTVRVKGDDREKAINSAIAHYRRKGYKVHDHHYIGTVDQGVAEGQLELNTPDPVVVVQDLKGNILDKVNLSVAAQKYKLGQPENIKKQLAHQNYTKVGNYTIVSPMTGQPQDQTTTGQKTTVATPGMAEASLGDYRNKATVNKAVAQANRFLDRDDAAKVAAADQTIAKRERGLARADARVKPYTPPPAAPADLKKQQRDLTAKYPNIDELVAAAEQRRDPNYDYAEGNAYYDGREAEQNYQKLKQIQRVIQGLNESLVTMTAQSPAAPTAPTAPAAATGPKTKELGTGTGRVNPATGRPWTPSELKAKYAQPQPTAPTPDSEPPAPSPEPEPLAPKNSSDPFKAKRDAAALAAQQAMGDVASPAPTAPTPAPAPATTTPSGPPGFNAGNLAQLPGMSQSMQPKPAAPKPVTNYGPGPAGYKSSNFRVGPTATKSTTAAPAGKKPTTQQQQEYYKYLGLAEDLSWSKNFDPGRSLYRQIKQDR